jgi:hypothetical protein
MLGVEGAGSLCLAVMMQHRQFVQLGLYVASCAGQTKREQK